MEVIMQVELRDKSLQHTLLIDQHRKVNTLIRSECCNYDNDNCMLLDDGAYHKCPQLASSTLNCKWFVEAVLPLDSLLKDEIFHTIKRDVQRCSSCGTEIVRKSNRSKYCPKCSFKMYKQQKAENQRKRRSSKNIS